MEDVKCYYTKTILTRDENKRFVRFVWLSLKIDDLLKKNGFSFSLIWDADLHYIYLLISEFLLNFELWP